MKITKSNRFNYAKRLEREASVKAGVNNILTLMSIVAGIYIIAYAKELDAMVSALVGAFVAGVSIIQLLLALERPVSVLSKKASDAHRCGRDISQVYRELQLKQISDDSAAEKYENIVSNYEDNHDRVDYMMTLYQYKSKFPEKAKGRNWLNSVLPYRIYSFSSVIFTVFCLFILVSIWIALPLIPKKLGASTPSPQQVEHKTSE